MTKEKILERNARQREYRKSNGNRLTKRYEKTKKGFLMRLYRNMESRIVGVQKEKYHLYEGKELMCREDFYSWALMNKDFHSLFEAYELSCYDRKLCPSVDRIDSKIGYRIENIEFVTHSENSRRGAISKRVHNKST
jgi:hypothetical protein